MAQFTPGGFGTHMANMMVLIDHIMEESLKIAGETVEKEAKALIGTYEAGWPALSPYTVERKATGDSPLLETGELRDSIEHTVVINKGVGMHAYVGSNNQKAVWNFWGTGRIPPRDPLIPAVMRKMPEIVSQIGALSHSILIGKGK